MAIKEERKRMSLSMEARGMLKRMTAALLCLALALIGLVPAALAESEQKTVRVGWYDTPFNYKDAFDRRTGYAYEYQRKIAAYTGWEYEYVEGTWPELLQMLMDGRIDLMSDVSYVEDRRDRMLYTNIPMGSEIYLLYISTDNMEIRLEDTTTLNGKKVGITRDTVQVGLFRNWLDSQGLRVDLVELDGSEQESLELMRRGEIDAFVTLDNYEDWNADIAKPLWTIGSSDFYFAVSKDRPDLLAELNVALSRIQEENNYYNEQLSSKYLSNRGTNQYLTTDESAWLEEHGPIRVGYQNNYMAFCAVDPNTGELIGALKDYLDAASDVLENAHPTFEAIGYPTAQAAMEALRDGEIDCMFPANLTDYDGEQAGVVLTAPLMRTEMDAVVRASDQKEFLRQQQVRVGVNRGNPNYEMFLLDHFPSWTPVYYTDTPACLDAVAKRAADCVIISNYRFGDISRQCSRLNLTTVYTGVDMDYCFAVREGNATLYSILSRIIRLVPDSTVNAALTYYSAQTGKASALDFLREHPSIAVLDAVCLALIVAVIVLAGKLRKKEKPAGK